MGSRGPTSKKQEKASIRFRPGVPPAPSWLDADAAKEYARAAAELKAADGALQQADCYTLATYAQACSDVARITLKIRAEGDVITTPQGAIANPRLRALSLAQRSLAQATAKLGFSPADRARVPKSAATGKPDNAFHGFVK
jgi:P27 family predicted phage terminase small subunit